MMITMTNMMNQIKTETEEKREKNIEEEIPCILTVYRQYVYNFLEIRL